MALQSYPPPIYLVGIIATGRIFLSGWESFCWKQKRDALPGHFHRIENFIRERVGKYKRGELSGGGLKRSRGGTWGTGFFEGGRKESWDERILGDGDFVDSVFKVEGRDGKQDPECLCRRL